MCLCFVCLKGKIKCQLISCIFFLFSFFFLNRWILLLVSSLRILHWLDSDCSKSKGIVQLFSDKYSVLFLLSIRCRQQRRKLSAEEGTCSPSAGLHQLLDSEVSASENQSSCFCFSSLCVWCGVFFSSSFLVRLKYLKLNPFTSC